jgi:hypothetical protein
MTKIKCMGSTLVKVIGLLVITAVTDKQVQIFWILPVTHSVKELLPGNRMFTGMTHRPAVKLDFC